MAKLLDNALPLAQTQHLQWEQALAAFLTPILAGLTLLEWGLFCQHIHWDLPFKAIVFTLFSLGFAKFALLLMRYREGQRGAKLLSKGAQVFWVCASLPILFYLLAA